MKTVYHRHHDFKVLCRSTHLSLNVSWLEFIRFACKGGDADGFPGSPRVVQPETRASRVCNSPLGLPPEGNRLEVFTGVSSSAQSRWLAVALQGLTLGRTPRPVDYAPRRAFCRNPHFCCPLSAYLILIIFRQLRIVQNYLTVCRIMTKVKIVIFSSFFHFDVNFAWRH